MIHDDLLELAEHLACRDPGRPKHVSLRQAVSSAYYSVFHALAFLCADTLVGWPKPWEAVTPIYRALDHGVAKKLFERDRSGALLGGEVAEIGNIFISLQRARHTADYDPRPFSYSRGEALELIDQARRAVHATLALSQESRLLLARPFDWKATIASEHRRSP